MVRGLDRFRQYFAPFVDRYALIGGTACAISMEEVGLDFRATRDLDIVLCVEALDQKFAEAFWEFIKSGGYQNRQKSTGKKLFYRFYAPSDFTYPEMLELFSRKPDAIELNPESHLTPIPMEDEISSLSAILLDEDYYRFIHEGKRKIGELAVVDPAHLIPLKARAWLDLFDRRNAGATIDEKDVRKHKNDILRLYQLLSLGNRIVLPRSVREDMRKFLDSIKDAPVDLKVFGIKNTSLDEVMSHIRQIYDL